MPGRIRQRLRGGARGPERGEVGRSRLGILVETGFEMSQCLSQDQEMGRRCNDVNNKTTCLQAIFSTVLHF